MVLGIAVISIASLKGNKPLLLLNIFKRNIRTVKFCFFHKDIKTKLVFNLVQVSLTPYPVNIVDCYTTQMCGMPF